MATTILIVDDDRTLVEVLNVALTRAGFETRVAYEGSQAMRMVTSQRVDLIVLDVMLPDIDGYEICRRVRALPRMGEMPVLMLSARSQVADRLTGFEAGADDYVAKPVVIKELIARIWTLLNRSQRARGASVPVIAFIGAKGGVGTTTTALNVVLSLQSGDSKGVLVELSSVGATMPWLLSMPPRQNLLALATPESFRASLPALQTCIFTHGSELDYLAGHGTDVSQAAFRAGILAEMITLLQFCYHHVVLDISASALATCQEALVHSSIILPVAEYDSVSIWHLGTLMGWLRQGQLANKVPGFILVDRSPGPVKDPPSALASEVGLDIMAIIPPAVEALYHANSRQEPLYLADPAHPASQAMADLGKRLMKSPVKAPVSPEA